MLRGIASHQRKEIVLPLRIKGTGTAAVQEGGEHVTLTDNGTGDYTITFKTPFARLPVVGSPVIVGATSGVCRISAVSATAVRILAFGVNGTSAADVDLHVIIHGFMAADQT